MALRSALERASVAVASGFYLSYIPVKLAGARRPLQEGRTAALRGRRFLARRHWTGSGLIGTACGLILVPLIPGQGAGCAFFMIGAIAASCWLCGVAERVLNRHDDQRIILDEAVGYWTAIAFLPRTPAVLAAAFVLFRVFDAGKIPPVNLLARLPGGIGVVADDVGAGLIANIILQGSLRLWPGVLA